MKFNELIIERLGVILTKYNLHIVDQFENYLKLQSKNLNIILTYNSLENSNTFWIGRNIDNSDNIEIDDTLLREFFQSDLKISLCTTDLFLENLLVFFEREGKVLLGGNLNKLIELEEYGRERSRLYTMQLVDKQNLNAADNAWAENNYGEFIKYIDKINKERLPRSYELKYKIALKRF